jgi:hypothetical protein
MSRAQEQQVGLTASADSASDQNAAHGALQDENQDISNYQQQLSKLAASNPYAEGGEFDTATDQKLSGVADAGSGAISNQLQTQAARTGENAGSAVATSAEAARANERQLSSDEAGATQERIGDESAYNNQVQNDEAVPAELKAGEYSTATGGADSTLGTAAQASGQPGFWDTLGSNYAQGLGQSAGKATSSGLMGLAGSF